MSAAKRSVQCSKCGYFWSIPLTASQGPCPRCHSQPAETQGSPDLFLNDLAQFEGFTRPTSDTEDIPTDPSFFDGIAGSAELSQPDAPGIRKDPEPIDETQFTPIDIHATETLKCEQCGVELTVGSPNSNEFSMNFHSEIISMGKESSRIRITCMNCNHQMIIDAPGYSSYKLTIAGLPVPLSPYGCVSVIMVFILLVMIGQNYSWSGAFLSVVTLLLSWFTLHNAYTIWQGGKSHSWRKVPAKIVHCEITRSVTTNSDGDSTTVETAYIRYKYQIDGIDHESNQLDAADSNTLDGFLSKSARKWVAKYPAGREVVAYVNPEDHNDAVLEPGVKWVLLFFYTAFGLACAAGMVSAIFATLAGNFAP